MNAIDQMKAMAKRENAAMRKRCGLQFRPLHLAGRVVEDVAKRRSKVMDLLEGGMTRAEVARHFEVSIDTIKNDVSIMRRAG